MLLLIFSLCKGTELYINPTQNQLKKTTISLGTFPITKGFRCFALCALIKKLN